MNLTHLTSDIYSVTVYIYASHADFFDVEKQSFPGYDSSGLFQKPP